MKINAEQIAHLTEHIDQFVAVTGEEDVAGYFKTHPEASYAAVCDVLDITPLEDKAEQKAEEAFAAMTAREHRKAAQHIVTCPNDGMMNSLGLMPVPIPSEEIFLASYAGLLAGKPTGGMTASKVENLQKAKEQIEKMREFLTQAEDHLNAAIDKYTAADA